MMEVRRVEGYKAPRPELSRTREVDLELEELIAARRAAIKVCGIGGAGGNTITRMMEIGIKGAELIAMNTDAQDLLCTLADKKILLGKELTKGLGAGAIPEIGRQAAKEAIPEIKKALEGADMVFITCGLGGGTGSGGAPVVAEVARKLGALTVAVVTLPFTGEGRVRMKNAIASWEELSEIVNTLITIPNDKLLEVVPDLPLNAAFRVADEILTNAVKGITELVTQPGLVNLDFADVRTIMEEGGPSMISIGESDTENRARESVEKALNNPLLDLDISGSKGALVNVVGGPTMTLEEAQEVANLIKEKLSEEANLIWGAQVMPDMHNTIRTMIIATGVRSPQIFGAKKSVTEERRKEMQERLGIKFI